MVFQRRLLRIRYCNIIFMLGMFTTVFVFLSKYKDIEYIKEYDDSSLNSYSVVEVFYEKRKAWTTSKLGSILFKNENYPVLSKERANKTFVILIWKRWKFLQNRHIFYFGSTRHDPFEECSVNNCIFSGDDSLLNAADAVMVHLHTAMIPKTKRRNPLQKWIFLDDESPKNSFNLAKKQPTLSELANVFNWSMTYRSEADIPVPYGRTIARYNTSTKPISEIVPNWKNKRRDVLATILISNCGISYRMKLLEELKKLLQIHIHGKCGAKEFKNSCPGHFKADCKVLSKYLFYIVLENSKCKEYISEKLYYHAYSRGAIPIIQGPSIEDCERLLPPNSYLHFDNYATLGDLVKDLKIISENDERLLSFHLWRKHFEAHNEHGYFGSKSYHLCRLCEAMNYNDMKTSIYGEDDLRMFLDKNQLCRN